MFLYLFSYLFLHVFLHPFLYLFLYRFCVFPATGLGPGQAPLSGSGHSCSNCVHSCWQSCSNCGHSCSNCGQGCSNCRPWSRQSSSTNVSASVSVFVSVAILVPPVYFFIIEFLHIGTAKYSRSKLSMGTLKGANVGLDLEYSAGVFLYSLNSL